jgi:hypothetical protein
MAMAKQKQDRDALFRIDFWMTVGAFALAVLMLVLATQVHAQTFTVLHGFLVEPTDRFPSPA